MFLFYAVCDGFCEERRNIMDQLIEILNGMHPEVDFETCYTLIDDKIIDSFDIVTLISDITEEFDISIPVEEIVPKNFNSAKAIYAMVERLMDE
jgi:D-alanine--poly(phosphoribitol) ligase subunit 2